MGVSVDEARHGDHLVGSDHPRARWSRKRRPDSNDCAIPDVNIALGQVTNRQVHAEDLGAGNEELPTLWKASTWAADSLR